jgi:hypothetical protein
VPARGTGRAPTAGVRTSIPTSRSRAVGAGLAAAAVLAAAPAHAQIVGVPQAPPRAATAVRDTLGDSTIAARPPVDRDTLLERQRLDIQAWVDSAAPALAGAPRPSPAAATEVPRVDPPVRTPRAPAPTGAPPAPRRPSQEAGRRPPAAAPR